jgi:hypothetical protein
MLTCHYKTNMQNWNRLVNDWQKFRLFLETHQTPLKYVAVVERQDRGAFHLHVVTSFVYIEWEDCLNAWREIIGEDGGFWISPKSGDPEKAATYLTQYLTDEKYMASHALLPGKKRYFSNLKPLSVNTYSNDVRNMEALLNECEKSGMVRNSYQYENVSTGKTDTYIIGIPLCDKEVVEKLCTDLDEELLFQGEETLIEGYDYIEKDSLGRLHTRFKRNSASG